MRETVTAPGRKCPASPGLGRTEFSSLSKELASDAINPSPSPVIGIGAAPSLLHEAS
jgi:hypothetical protein